MRQTSNAQNRLGPYLRDRRTRLDPSALGLPTDRRRTPGLRREEVAQRANISPTWYTWLEQGRGGAPSAEVLDRIARALMLTEREREHLFLIALGRPPDARYQGAQDVTPRLQRVLDALHPTPAVIRTATWDVVAWNRAASVLLTDYGLLDPSERNMLRFIFLNPRARDAHYDWEAVARLVVGAFRREAALAGAAADVQPLVEELLIQSPEFRRVWLDSDGPAHEPGAIKHLRHPILGPIAIELSMFAVDGRSDLRLLVYQPFTPADAERIASVLDRR